MLGQPVLSGVAMEEVCCRFARCRRRTSSLTLTLPRSKLVRLENQRFGFLLEEALSTFVYLPRKIEINPSCLTLWEILFLMLSVSF